MTLPAEAVKKLAAPLDAKRVKKREGSGGRSLSYLEGHDVIRAANDVFGIGEWTYFVTELTCLGEEPVVKTYNGTTREGFRVAYRAVVTVGSNGSGFSDVGYGDAQEYTGSKLTPHELASKEAVTDALKRALKNFGDQFGLCLYDKDAPEHYGSSAPRSGAPKVSAPASGPTANQSAGGGRAAGERAVPTAPPAAPSSFTPPAGAVKAAAQLVWKYGPHAGKTLEQTPLEFVVNYAETGKPGFMVDKCREFLAENGALTGADDDIPFDRTIDGLGN